MWNESVLHLVMCGVYWWKNEDKHHGNKKYPPKTMQSAINTRCLPASHSLDNDHVIASSFLWYCLRAKASWYDQWVMNYYTKKHPLLKEHSPPTFGPISLCTYTRPWVIFYKTICWISFWCEVNERNIDSQPLLRIELRAPVSTLTTELWHQSNRQPSHSCTSALHWFPVDTRWHCNNHEKVLIWSLQG